MSDTTARAGFFPGFDFGANYTTAFDATGRSQVIGPLLENLVGDNINTQPTNTAIETELNGLIDKLTVCSGNCGGRTETIVKASCAAVLGSAVTLIQ